MSFRERIRELFPHAVWALLERTGDWLYEHVPWRIVVPFMLTVLGSIVQKLQGVPYDLWILGILFFGSLGLMAYFHKREQKLVTNRISSDEKEDVKEIPDECRRSRDRFVDFVRTNESFKTVVSN